MNFLNSIFYKSLAALYKLNTNSNNRSKNVIIDAIYEALVIGKNGLDDAKLAMALETATDEWLDFWGNHFNVLRTQKESDEFYRKRIIEEIISPKNTIPAIKKATSRYIKLHTNEDVRIGDIKIFEPWTMLLITDSNGTIDGTGRMISYDYWNYSVIDIALPNSSLITPGLIKYLNAIKAAGIKLVFSIAPQWDIAIDINKEQTKNNIWKKILQERFITVLRSSSQAFKLGDFDLSGSLIDENGMLEGRQLVFNSGVVFNRSYYTTGPIRNFNYSGILSLLDYQVETIEEAIELEEKSYKGTRLKEGKLSIIQNNIEIKHEKNN